MTGYLIVILVWAVLLAFWLWLGALFDWITNYQHPTHTSSATRREAAQATKGKGSS